MAKRLLDIVFASLGLLLASAILLPLMFLVWWEDKHSPFYIASRVARGGGNFRMVKLRSMIINADRIGSSSTSNADRRITPVGRFIRRFKIDEITQLWNVLRGDMSLVGPRPQVEAGVAVYTSRERELLNLRPGITDFASIVFSDEGAILQNSTDPDADYDALIRPWKNRLGLVYAARRSLWLDLQLIVTTAIAVTSRERALRLIQNMLEKVGAPEDVRRVAARKQPLVPSPPPGEEFCV